jgi:hypothetical protein
MGLISSGWFLFIPSGGSRMGRGMGFERMARTEGFFEGESVEGIQLGFGLVWKRGRRLLDMGFERFTY